MEQLEVLATTECWQLLSQRTVGRVAYTDRALPVIVPLNYSLVGQRIMVRCRADGLAARLDGQVVAFQIDDIDLEGLGGWSVLVTGTCRRLTAPSELLRVDHLPPSWAGPDHHTAVFITPGNIEGRRLHPVSLTSVG